MDEKTARYFKTPGRYLKVFEPTREKLAILADKLMNTPMYLSDEYRTPEQIAMLMEYWFPFNIDKSVRPINVFYEVGDFGGLFGFVAIQPEWKADLFVKLWDKNIWGPTLARDVRSLIKKFMIEWKLKRLSLSSPDDKSCKYFVNICGFRTEGTQGKACSWKGKLIPNFLYRKILEDREVR